MEQYKQIESKEFNESPFSLIGTDWLLITAEKDGKQNTMTASWGGLGHLWNKDVAYIVLRPQRYTKQFVDAADTFSLTVFDNSFKKQLGYLGTVSGKDENKIEKTGLTVAHELDTPYFTEAKTVLICKKLYAQPFEPECFLDKSLCEQCYPEKDYHTLYIGEVLKIMVKE